MGGTGAGGALGDPGVYVTGDPGGVDDSASIGMLGIRIGLGWAKSHHFATGQCPVMRYHRQLMNAILYDKIQIAKATQESWNANYAQRTRNSVRQRHRPTNCEVNCVMRHPAIKRSNWT